MDYSDFENLKNIVNQTDEICKASILKHGNSALQFIRDQNDDICKFAIENDRTGNVLKYITVQTDELCKLAIKHNPQNILYVKNFENAVKYMHLTGMPIYTPNTYITVNF